MGMGGGRRRLKKRNTGWRLGYDGMWVHGLWGGGRGRGGEG